VAHILVVDDEEPLRLSLGYSLSKEGYSVSTAVDGPSALAAASSLRPDAILLDVMLPGLDGMEVCRRIRAGSDVPIILLTARDATGDAIAGLECGADDYVTKPFSTGVLLARLRSVMRRRASAQRLLDEDRVLLNQLDELVRRGEDLLPPVRAGSGAVTARVMVDPATRRASVDGTALDLSVSGAAAIITLSERRPLPPDLRELSLAFVLRNIHGLACWYVDSRIPLHAAQFPFPAPAHAEFPPFHG
jgi:DNA-binding response OmpR family regulator